MELHAGIFLEQKAQYEVQRLPILPIKVLLPHLFMNVNEGISIIFQIILPLNFNCYSIERICIDKNAENCDEIITGKRKRGKPRYSLPQLPTIDDDQLSDASSDEFPDDSCLFRRTISTVSSPIIMNRNL